MDVVDGRRLVATRWIARAPRVALIAVCAVLAIAGLRSTFTPRHAGSANTTRPVVTADVGADAMAEAFVRAYLTWDGATADRLAPFGAAVSPPDLPASARQHVEWTAVAASQRRGRERVVTVAALTDHGAYSVAVTLIRTSADALAVAAPPAIVGAPPIDVHPRVESLPELTDGAVQTVLRRALTNYLAGDHTDLMADLDAGVHISLPQQVLRVRAVDAYSWRVPGRQAVVELRAALQPGAVLTLRYDVDLLRRGARWLVRSIQSSSIPGRSS